MFSGIRRNFRPSSDRAETPSSPQRRAGPQAGSPMAPALQPRRGGNEGAAPSSPPRPPRNRNALGAIASLMRSPQRHATERASPQAGTSRPGPAQVALTVAQDVDQWRQAAERDLPNMTADYGQYDLHAQDIRPMYVQQVARTLARAAEQGLTHVTIEHLPAASLPHSIGRLPHLEELSVRGTECIGLPDSIGDLANLTHLNVAGNPGIKRLPEGIARLDQLTTLRATAMPLQVLPQGIGGLHRLTELRLSGGSYEQLPQGFTSLSALKTLQISASRPSRGGGQGLQVLPHDMGRLRSLETLDLSSQRSLRTLPDSLADLAQLRELNLADCSKLTELPRQFGRLQSLTTLTLKRNDGLLRLPESLGNLTRLAQLDLSDCKNLQALPASMGDLQSLLKLDLTGCTGLRELPASLSQLPANCQILVPLGLQAQLRQLRPPRRRAGQATGAGAPARPRVRPRPAALPPRPARPAATPPPVTATQVAAWKERLAPFSREDGANRFSQWTDAVCRRQGEGGLTDNGVAQMERIVQAASRSAPLRAKLFAFATEHVRVQRDMETGVTMNHVPAQTFMGVNEAHDVYLTHMVSDPRHASRHEAYALLREAVRERFGRMAPNEALLALAGRAPRGTPSDRYSARPWPALAAYVQTHDKAGQDFATRGGDVIGALADASADGDIHEHDMLVGADTVKHAQAMLLHDRYLAVATALLGQRAPARTPALNPARR